MKTMLNDINLILVDSKKIYNLCLFLNLKKVNYNAKWIENKCHFNIIKIKECLLNKVLNYIL
jgi:hypothetical protein